MTAGTIDANIERARESWRQGDGTETDRLCQEILSADPDNGPALLLLAEVRLTGEPGSAMAHHLMAHALRRMDRARDAIVHAEAAVSAAPDNVEFRMMLAMALREAGALDRAIETLQATVGLDAGLTVARLNLGRALTEAGRAVEAISVLQELVAAEPTLGGAWLQLGNAYREAGDSDGAVNSYRAACDANPDDARAHSNLGVALQQCGDFDAAAESFSTAIAHDPQLAEAHKNLAMLRLLRGDFSLGFEGFAWRWKQDGPVNRPRPFQQPAWDGSALTGKTVLVWGEQGVGDEIMFASLFEEVIAQAGHTLIECEARLVPLFQRSFPNAEIFARTDTPHQRLTRSDIDFQCASGDLCRWLRGDRAAFGQQRAFLKADTGMRQARRATYDALGVGSKIGIAWRSRTPLWGAIKSAPLSQWAPILQKPNTVWVNLQYGDCDEEISLINRELGVKIHQDSDVNQFGSLDAFAGQVAALDLVVTTSNTAAHMAGALGVPALLLLPAVPDWRWQVSGDTAHWYPRMKIFRQTTRGDWSGPIGAAAKEIDAHVNARATSA